MAPQAGNNSVEEGLVDYNTDCSIEFGKILAHPKPGDEVVISGLSGTYPESDNVHEFRDNLFNKTDMVTDDNRRWEDDHPEIPHRIGKVPKLEKFDAGFFGLHHRQATCIDPMLRVLLEKVTEAIFDAGINPSDLEGTNTGVFVGFCYSEAEKTWFSDQLVPQGYAIMGCEKSMEARRISYFLKLKGTSYTCDTACSSSLYALEHAFRAIRTGQCDRAIVGGANICLHPFMTLQSSRLGTLSMDGKCKVFDNDANGYVRSDAISALILQKASEAKRNYGTVLHCKAIADGCKDSGITYPSREIQMLLLKEFYEECNTVNPTDLSFIEAHGTGTRVGDPEELQAIEAVCLPGRTTPLPIGSVKSNIGHTEAASGLCSVTKAVIIFETGYIPPNLHYKTPKAGVKSLEDGRLQVVTEKQPFNEDKGLIATNSFGFGGANCHMLLKHNTKKKVNNGRPKDNIPRLVCVSGRTKEAVDVLLDDVIENHGDAEHIRLLQEVFRKNVVGHHYRGYSLVTKSGEVSRSFNFNAGKMPTLVVCFGVIDETIKKHAEKFLEVPLVAGTIQRIYEILITKGANISEILTKTQNSTILETVLANFTIQIVIADILKALGIVPDKVFGINKGLSLGSLVCAYFDEALSLKEAVECAYAIAHTTYSVSVNDGNNSRELDALLETLTKILPEPRKLSNKVIVEGTAPEVSSRSLSNCFGDTEVVNYVKNTLKKNFAIFEVGNGNVNEDLKKNFDHVDAKFFINTSGGLEELLISLGRLYELGYNPQIQNLFPKVQFPVTRGTPMISPKIKWNHSNDWWVSKFECKDQIKIGEKRYGVSLNEPDYTFVEDYIIDGRNLFPATGYLQLAWETLADVHGLIISDMKVVFENCKFKRACSVPKEGQKLELTVMVQRGTGNFEVIEGGTPVATGRITQASNDESDPTPILLPQKIEHTPTMSTKDVYKEFKLRGYNYRGHFKGIKSCDVNIQVAEVAWENNWVTFMENMLQMKILQEDTRLLYVPTTIQRLSIDAKEHISYTQTFGEEKPNLPVFISKETGIIRCGSIEIRGLNASSIPRKKYMGTPVLEKYIFVPNVAKLNTDQAVRANMQILLENVYSVKVKAVELIDEATSKDVEPLGDLIHDALEDQPYIQSDITILSKTGLEVRNVKMEDKTLLTEIDCNLIVGSKILQRKDVLQLVFGSLKENGFILSREPLDCDITSYNNEGITVITTFTTDQEKLIFFKKNTEFQTPAVVKVSAEDNEFTWLPKLKRAIEKNDSVVIYAQGEPLNGALGLVNCIRLEPNGQKVKLVFLPDSVDPEFDLTSPFYQEQLKKNLSINVFKNGQWGTYRHLLLEQGNQIEVEHCYLNSLVRGDLSSLKWIKGPLSNKTPAKPEQNIVSVYYAAVNFRDVMTASGKINVDAITKDRREQENVYGSEFSGRTQDGKRVMGIVANGACGTLLEADKDLLWEVPSGWSLADAATVPMVYGTCMFSLYKNGRMRRGNTVLIHSGAGGVGQAAITIALHAGCTVYTTVGTPEKREFLKKKFPQLTDANIANSRDTSFEKHIMKVTNGRGVDIVLNSLAEEKLLASVRCLARGGRFIEIGKSDLSSDNQLNLVLLGKEASFHGFTLDDLFNKDVWVKSELFKIVQDGINNGSIKPLTNTVFNMSQSDEAFRYMSSGKHMGKVLIRIRQEEKENIIKPVPLTFLAIPSYYCDENKTYIICGGLGGFGLELADWLVLRGCKKLVLSSRSGIKNGYQAYRISIWKSYGCVVQISTDDVTTYEGCQNMIKEANKLGPVHAIFNLAVVLKNDFLENQTAEHFKITFAPKAYATEQLDIVSRKFCPELRDFVIFSTSSCGRGYVEQTNYGMANSVLERICEQRRNEGFPAVAIQWGSIGDVGFVAESRNEDVEIQIAGTIEQSITNCLQCVDIFLRQTESAIVSSLVVAEKRAAAGNLVDAVANILGIKDLKSISLQATLAEVGMDSMTAVDIKQTLEREFELFFPDQDIKNMTFADLIEIQAGDGAKNQAETKETPALVGMDVIVRPVDDLSVANTPVLPIKGKKSDKRSLPTVVLFPGIEGVISVLEPLYRNLEAHVVGLQFPNDTQKDTIEDMASTCLPLIEDRISKSEPFNILCYSFGGIVGLEAVHQLEEKGYKGTVICIDSAPDYFKRLTQILDVASEDKFQLALLVHLMSLQISHDVIAKHLEALLKCNDFEARLNLAETIVGPNCQHKPEHLRAFAVSLYKRFKALVKWNPEYKIKSKVILFKPTLASIDLPDEDYGLSKICVNPVKVRKFDGNHSTVLEDPDVPIAVLESFGLVKCLNENGRKGDLLINVDKVQIKEPTKLK